MKALRRVIFSLMIIALLSSFIACDGFAPKEYKATDDSLLAYTAVEGGYSVAAAAEAQLPETVYLPKTYNDQPVIAVAAEGFKGTNIKKVVVPANVKSLYESAFSGCLALEEVYFYKGIEIIDANAFYGCAMLSEVSMPRSLKTIGDSAFYGCGFDKINLGECVESVGSAAFAYCLSLKYVYIPVHVEDIGAYAFDHCSDKLEFELSASNEYYSLVEGKPVQK